MTLASRALSRLLRLPPAKHPRVTRQRDLAAVMPDGVVLLANRWFPQGQEVGLPTVLMRSPYGRSGPWAFEAALLAERGYNVIVQSCRGTYGSGGDWEPFRNEGADGAATVEWIQKQPWYDGRLVTYGSSYCGYTQFAIAANVPVGVVGAMSAAVAAADFRALIYPFGIFSLENLADWLHGLDSARNHGGVIGTVRGMRSAAPARQRAAAAVPLREADVASIGHPEQCFRDWLDHADLDDSYWDRMVHTAGLDRPDGPPVSLHGGWFDLFAPYVFEDYSRLVAAGRDVELTVGPWAHGGGFGNRIRDALELFDREMYGATAPRRAKPIHVQLWNDKRWLHYSSWPPPATTQRWHLHAGGGLSTDAPADSLPDSYRYDPSDPAPSVGGAALNKGGPKDNAAREARPDVLTFTSIPLRSDLLVLGPVTARIHTRASTPHFDVVLRLCDVDEKGVSRNISDGVARVDLVAQTDEPTAVDVTLWPVGARFAAGHRIRLQVASALHPLFARNLGSGEPAASAASIVASNHEVWHDPAHPSGVDLPIIELGPDDILPS